jgi:hypothetical protein
MTRKFIVTIVHLAAFAGSLPFWPHSQNWGYSPIGAVSGIVPIVLALAVTGYLLVSTELPRERARTVVLPWPRFAI